MTAEVHLVFNKKTTHKKLFCSQNTMVDSRTLHVHQYDLTLTGKAKLLFSQQICHCA